MSTRKRQNRSTRIFDTIRQRIIDWEYPPNYPLREEALCREFGVSRVPVREALHMLEKHNLVSKVPYQGCRVQQPDLQEIRELYDVRLALELFVVEVLAGAGMAEDGWAPLYDTWQEFYQVDATDTLDRARYAREDETFHETLARATGNRSLVAMLHDLNERLSFVRVMDIQNVERLRKTCEQHLAMLDHVRAGNVAEAREAMRLNIEFGRNNVDVAVRDALAKAYLSQ